MSKDCKLLELVNRGIDSWQRALGLMVVKASAAGLGICRQLCQSFFYPIKHALSYSKRKSTWVKHALDHSLFPATKISTVYAILTQNACTLNAFYHSLFLISSNPKPAALNSHHPDVIVNNKVSVKLPF